MIEGTVNAAREAVIGVSLRGPTGRTLRVDAVVDTGFSRYVTLTPSKVAHLGLASVGTSRVVLADGSETPLDVHAVTLYWDGQPRDVVAYASDTTPLVGMALLDGHNLYVEVEEGGQVLIRPRP